MPAHAVGAGLRGWWVGMARTLADLAAKCVVGNGTALGALGTSGALREAVWRMASTQGLVGLTPLLAEIASRANAASLPGIVGMAASVDCGGAEARRVGTPFLWNLLAYAMNGTRVSVVGGDPVSTSVRWQVHSSCSVRCGGCGWSCALGMRCVGKRVARPSRARSLGATGTGTGDRSPLEGCVKGCSYVCALDVETLSFPLQALVQM